MVLIVLNGTVTGEAAAGVVAASWCDTARASANKMLLEVLYLVVYQLPLYTVRLLLVL
jgi:hypothetical protein